VVVLIGAEGARLLREKQAWQDPTDEVRVEAACGLPEESEHPKRKLKMCDFFSSQESANQKIKNQLNNYKLNWFIAVLIQIML
jgi:hypothetical protein